MRLHPRIRSAAAVAVENRPQRPIRRTLSGPEARIWTNRQSATGRQAHCRARAFAQLPAFLAFAPGQLLVFGAHEIQQLAHAGQDPGVTETRHARCPAQAPRAGPRRSAGRPPVPRGSSAGAAPPRPRPARRPVSTPSCRRSPGGEKGTLRRAPSGPSSFQWLSRPSMPSASVGSWPSALGSAGATARQARGDQALAADAQRLHDQVAAFDGSEAYPHGQIVPRAARPPDG